MAQSPAFGPTIWAEFTAAGVPVGTVQSVCPLDVLNPDGSVLYAAGTVLYGPDATADQRAAVAKVVAAHDPSRQLILVPDHISDRQCFQQLVAMGKVTQDEALAAVMVGALPKAVLDGIAALPPEQQFPARMLLCGATDFYRLHPMVPAFLSFFGLGGTADRDALWTAAALL